MNAENKVPAPETIDVLQLARAVRFAIAGVVLPQCYLSLRSSLSIPAFASIFRDMLGGKPLPAMTEWTLFLAPVFLIIAVLLPIIAITTLFSKNVVRSFYILGGVGVLTVLEFIILYHALTAPLFEVIRRMGGNP